MEKNRIELTGTIRKMYRLKTKAGDPMVKVLLQVGKDTFWVLGYGNIAVTVFPLQEGDELAISGIAQMNNWKDEAGDWHNDFNAVAWAAEINGQKVNYDKQAQPAKQQETVTRSHQPWQQNNPDQPPPPDDRDPSQYAYSGGPF